MLTAQVTCVEDNERCGEQCAGGDDGYCVDFHVGRSRRANFSVANIIRKDDWNETIFSASTNACIMSTFWLAPPRLGRLGGHEDSAPTRGWGRNPKARSA